MPSKPEKDLASIGAESAHRVRNAHASCRDARDHINPSREAIARSFKMLGRTDDFASSRTELNRRILSSSHQLQ